MKRIATTLVVLALVGAYTASAHDMSKHAAGSRDTSKKVTSTITGEVVDAGCYLGHSARGAAHVDCATQCILGGMPMCLVTPQGAVYLLTMNHGAPDPYNKLKAMPGKTVAVTGVVMTRGGMKGIDVAAVKMPENLAGPRLP